ncbi:MAG: hypothetical protein ABII00_11070, partial [Elusimicrobiota bacterium]
MANLQQIVAYLRQYKDKYPVAALRSQLLKQGVPAAMIDQAIRVVAGQATAPPPQQRPPQGGGAQGPARAAGPGQGAPARPATP